MVDKEVPEDMHNNFLTWAGSLQELVDGEVQLVAINSLSPASCKSTLDSLVCSRAAVSSCAVWSQPKQLDTLMNSTEDRSTSTCEVRVVVVLTWRPSNSYSRNN